MTFEGFQATRTAVSNLAEKFPEMCWEENSTASGLSYLNELYIEKVDETWPEDVRKRGQWYLILGRCEYITDDLAMLERRLYAYAMSEGYCE